MITGYSLHSIVDLSVLIQYLESRGVGSFNLLEELRDVSWGDAAYTLVPFSVIVRAAEGADDIDEAEYRDFRGLLDHDTLINLET